MELRHLRYFKAVVEAKGYRNASRQFHIAQPALSQAVADLEEELGLKLFLRKGVQVQLTSAGETFYREALRTLEQAAAAIDAAKRANKGQTGTLRIGFIPSATRHFLPQLIRSFKQQNPGIQLSLRELTPAKQIEAFTRGELDLGFTREIEEGHPIYRSRLLFTVPLIAVLPTTRVLSDTSVQLQDLAHERFILLGRAESPSLFDSIVALCHDTGFSPQFDGYAYLGESMFLMVAAGEGIAIVPAWAHAFFVDGVQVATLLPQSVKIELVLMWRRHDASLALQSFLTLVDGELRTIRAETHRLFGAATPDL